VFAKFVEPTDDYPTIYTIEMAEQQLRFLIDKEMVIVNGDVVEIHPRFSEAIDPLPQAM
jgi:hypothetical protein